ncbi:hypothetical protein pb186bvf_007543 [Paramecium bursaria]
MDDLNLNPIDSFIIYAHDQNKNTIINPVDIRDSAFKRDQIVFKPQLPFQQQQPQILRSNTLQEVEPIVRSKIKILSTMVIDNQFNLEQERMNKTWNQSHKPIFVAVDNIEKAINKYNKEIPEFLKDDFMKSITINNFYQDLENVNAELNKSKRYMEKKSELDNLKKRTKNKFPILILRVPKSDVLTYGERISI